MTVEEFKNNFNEFLIDLSRSISIEDGDWTVKGFIDIYKNVYTISGDTKVVSKLIELMIFPLISRFSNKNKYRLILRANTVTLG